MIKMSKHHILGLSLTLLGIMLLASCDLLEEPKAPSWTNRIEFPLANTSVNLSSLEDEDNISSQLYDSSGTRRIYAFSDTSELDSQKVGDQLIFNDIAKSISQSVDDVTVTGTSKDQSSGFDAIGVDPVQNNIQTAVGTIQLADIPASSTTAITLRKIYPTIDSVPDGNEIVPEGDLDTIRTDFTFDDFNSATFVGGTLDITINNNMVIHLGSPIDVQLQEVVGVDTVDIPGASVQWTTVIAPNSSATQPLDLTGLTLPGTIYVQVSGHTIGSDGQAIPIDESARKSSFDISIAGSNLEVSEAEAKIPSQTVDDNGTINLAPSENKVERAKISEGNLSVTVDNQMSVDSKLILTIPSLEDINGAAFLDSVDLPNSGATTASFPVTDYFMVMDTSNQVVDYSYQVRTVDTGNNLKTLTDTDQVDVTIKLHGNTESDQVVFSSIVGAIKPQTVDNSGDINVASDSKILSAEIATGTIDIDIDNQINQPGSAGLPMLKLTINELLDGSNNPLSDSLLLQPSPSANTMNFDLSDYTLVFPDTNTQVLTYSTRVTTPSGEIGDYSLTDSILVNIDVSDMTFTTVTGYFSQDAMVDSNEIVLDEGTKLTQAVFETGNLMLSMTNGIGVVADVTFEITEFKHKISGQSLKTSFELLDNTGIQQTNVDLSDYNLEFASATPHVDQAIHYISKVALPPDLEMTLSFSDSIAIDVDITNLAMESIEGIIESDTLDIAETATEIVLPDMVSDLKFERVNIDIDFQSTFEVPIQLELNLSASNSENVTVDTTITHALTPSDDRISINAAALLNIHPESIVSSGMAIVGDNATSSRIAKGQGMVPVMYINVPLSLIIDSPSFIEQDVTGQDSPLPEDSTITLEEVTLFAEAVNQFEFGAVVVILASNDSLAFDSLARAQGISEPPDTLVSLDIAPLENVGVLENLEVNEIVLSTEKLPIIEERFWIQTNFQLVGQGSQPARFFTTDSLTLKAWGSMSYTIHGDRLFEEEG